jgi:hypothetical protein
MRHRQYLLPFLLLSSVHLFTSAAGSDHRNEQHSDNAQHHGGAARHVPRPPPPPPLPPAPVRSMESTAGIAECTLPKLSVEASCKPSLPAASIRHFPNVSVYFLGESLQRHLMQAFACAVGVVLAPGSDRETTFQAGQQRHDWECYRNARWTSREVCWIPGGQDKHGHRTSDPKYSQYMKEHLIGNRAHELLQRSGVLAGDIVVVNEGPHWRHDPQLAEDPHNSVEIRRINESLPGLEQLAAAGLRVFWRETAAQHFGTTTGSYPDACLPGHAGVCPRDAIGGPNFPKCVPLRQSAVDALHRRQRAVDALLSSINVPTLRTLSASFDMQDDHLGALTALDAKEAARLYPGNASRQAEYVALHRRVDCTHYCLDSHLVQSLTQRVIQIAFS